MNVFAHDGRSAEAEDVFRRLLSENLWPSTITMNVLLKAYVRGGNVDRALMFLDGMEHGKEHGYRARVDEGTYNVVISGLVEQNRVAEAWALVGRQRAAGFETSKAGKGLDNYEI